jgi:hypothetical protein
MGEDSSVGETLLNDGFASGKTQEHNKQMILQESRRKNVLFHDYRLFPSSVKYLVWNEFCERFSFYGMRTILALFLLEHVRMSETQATEVVHLFIVACYATPILGALLSDCYLVILRTKTFFFRKNCIALFLFMSRKDFPFRSAVFSSYLAYNVSKQVLFGFVF